MSAGLHITDTSVTGLGNNLLNESIPKIGLKAIIIADMDDTIVVFIKVPLISNFFTTSLSILSCSVYSLSKIDSLLHGLLTNAIAPSIFVK